MDSAGTTTAIESLVEEHYGLLYRFGYRLSGSAADAEDLTQQTFVTALQRLEQLRDPGCAKSWLCAILRNLYLATSRHEKCLDIAAIDNLAELPAKPAGDAVDSEALQQALDQLPEEFRTPVILFYFEEFSYKDIAEQMDLPVGTVMSRLSRAKACLRRVLAPLESDTSGNNPDAPEAGQTRKVSVEGQTWTA